MPASRTRPAKVGLAPDQANIGWLSGRNSPMSDVRAERTGPIGCDSPEWNTAMNRVTAPSTRSSYTTSAWLRPIWGREAGSTLSILTASAGRAATAGSVTGSPVSGYTGGGGGGAVVGVVVVASVVVVVVVVGVDPDDDPTWVATSAADPSTTTAAPPAMAFPCVVARKRGRGGRDS